jgi:hypothetical protein
MSHRPWGESIGVNEGKTNERKERKEVEGSFEDEASGSANLAHFYLRVVI